MLAQNRVSVGSGLLMPLPDKTDLSMEQRLRAAVERLQKDASDRPVKYAYTLRERQQDVFADVADFLGARLVSQDTVPWGRIILPPRIGKTVIAGSVVAGTGLATTFVTETQTLVEQAVRDFREQLPNTPIGCFYGPSEEVVPYGINVTTYSMLHYRWKKGEVPEPIRQSALILADEAHHSMTANRMEYLRNAFAERAIRIALTATPDYDEQRALVNFFPWLIHELSIEEAVTMDLMAPLRVYVAEVDEDASEVRLVHGDYDDAMMERILTKTPFFAAAKAYRYSDENRNTPALITCRTRQQAYDCVRYFEAHRPPASPKVGLVLGGMKNRNKILRWFDSGRIDTLVAVRALTEGWDAPQCKVLVDLALCMSRVTAIQKFCRVLTRQGDQEARIYTIVPKNLRRPPMTPMEILTPDMEEYEVGKLLYGKPQSTKPSPHIKYLPKIHPVESVTVKSRVVLVHRVEKPRLNPENPMQVRAVLKSHPRFSPEQPTRYPEFRHLVFRHELFTGRADHFMRHIGIRPSREGYEQLLGRYFPDALATLFLSDAGDPAGVSCREDYRHFREAVLAGPPATEEEQAKFEMTYYALGGRRPEDDDSPEQIVHWHRIWERAKALLPGLPPDKERKYVLGLYGIGQEPQSAEKLGEVDDLSRQSVLNWVSKGLHRLRLTLHPSLARALQSPDSTRVIRPWEAGRVISQARDTELGESGFARARSILDGSLEW